MRAVKFLAVTTGRADYGVFRPLLVRMARDPGIDLKIAATGGHLRPDQGMTVDEIEKDGLEVAYRVDLCLSGDTEGDVCAGIASGLKQFSGVFETCRPDAVIVLGDRYELWSVAVPAVIHRIPIVHLYGGDVTLGATDEVVRHSVTKMAALHFVSIQEHARRVVQMGEEPRRVFVVGALGLDNVREMELLSAEALRESTGVDFSRPVALMTFHPATHDGYSVAAAQVREILEALAGTDMVTLVTMPNTDVGGNAVFGEIARFERELPGRFVLRRNLGQRRYLSAMQLAQIVVGNSSSGIIESPTFRVPVVNVGSRQEGRVRARNVIDCEPNCESVREAINQARSQAFRDSLADLSNPYGDGQSAERIIGHLRSMDNGEWPRLTQKRFVDGPDLVVALPRT